MNEVAAWLQKAEADYQTARILMRQRKVLLPDNICWNCQQSAGKYLKAFLVRHAVACPRRHDLVQLGTIQPDCNRPLWALCARSAQADRWPEVQKGDLSHRHLYDIDFTHIADALATLDQFGTDIRYPGISASVQDAQQAFEALKCLRVFVGAKPGLGRVPSHASRLTPHALRLTPHATRQQLERCPVIRVNIACLP